MENLDGFKAFSHAVVCLDDDERTTVIARTTSEELAEKKLQELERRFPNAPFDIYTMADVKRAGIPLTENNWGSNWRNAS